MAQWIAPRAGFMPVRPADVLAADLASPFRPAALGTSPGEPLVVNWVTTPPSPGSGGHSTLFRIVNYLEAHGYLNRVYLYDAYGGDHTYYASIVRSYYGFAGPVLGIDTGMQDAHAVVATAWPTAYAVFNARCTGKRFYFVQDFEPHFYPTGTLSVLAENTYRMGFHCITAGSWLSREMHDNYGLDADSFDFGCDLDKYRYAAGSSRNGIAFYARPETARRGFELGALALEILSRRQPSVELHLYGEPIGKLSFDFVDHGRVTPQRLNHIYSKCRAGLSLSLTNVSLVPHEMLAAGCIPVINDAEHNRMVLANPFVRYAPLAPHALAAALEDILAMEDFDGLAAQAAASVRSASWDDAGATVDCVFRRTL